ncbi:MULTISPECIES: GTPase [unclassified Leeuwenhoekiella]|uniref:GTPase n=1 Tax=unclassified Leeuwenhoekiella TaxID=2615029 RepID=UPI000C3BFB18|nr:MULTISPECIES: GTPase [unclassified Leeuwenhoekiella]MAW96490.1 GTPase [Leeuwenhoekiella sp.]MBA81377.1 GTPase [Leeuwenhoekiella sp.]
MKLIFIYNANSGKRNAYLDSLHKVISPKTYPCSLCDITYGVFKIRPEWKAFRESSNLDMQFYHIDEFNDAYPDSKDIFQYPIVLKEEATGLAEFISKKELDALKDDRELIDLIQDKVNQSQAAH